MQLSALTVKGIIGSLKMISSINIYWLAHSRTIKNINTVKKNTS